MLFRTAVCVAALASLSLTVGCMGIPAVYAYPKISYFPATDLNSGGAEVEAFLVKTTCAWRQPCPGPENFPQQKCPACRCPICTLFHIRVSALKHLSARWGRSVMGQDWNITQRSFCIGQVRTCRNSTLGMEKDHRLETGYEHCGPGTGHRRFGFRSPVLAIPTARKSVRGR